MTKHLLILVASILFAACGPAPEPSATSERAPDAGVLVEESSALSVCPSCGLPTSGLYATFTVGTQSFSQQITSPAGMSDAIALWRGKSTKRVPSGRLRCGCQNWNCNWGFSLDPATVTFSTAAIELCDGTPSYVSANCRTFGTSYCPWTAVLTRLRDCRTNRTCPDVPK